MTEDKMIGWHHQLNEHEFEQDPGDGEGQKPGVLQSMELQRIGHDWATEGQQGKCSNYSSICTLLRVYPSVIPTVYKYPSILSNTFGQINLNLYKNALPDSTF